MVRRPDPWALVGQQCQRHSLPSRREHQQGKAESQGVSTSTASDAERVPDAFGVHRVTTLRQASKVAADRGYGFVLGLDAQGTRSGPRGHPVGSGRRT